MYVLFCRTNKKNVQQKEIKDLTSEFSNLSNHLFLINSNEDQTFRTSTPRRGGEVLKFVMCLQILLFSNNMSILYFCRWRIDGRGLFVKLIIVWCPILKLTLIKKVTFLALMPVLQWNSDLYFLIYVHSKWKVT